MPPVTTEPTFVELRARGAIGWIRADLAALGQEPFWSPLEPLAGAKGRGGVGVLRVSGIDMVVRPYRRGGALGRLLRDRYMHPTRARSELELLAALRHEGVPVVVPVAAVARRGRAFWRLRLCTELVLDALPAPAFLAAHPHLRRFAAEAVGIVVRLAFDAGLQHPDLHLDNVLCAVRGDRVRAVLVDLDRAKRKPPVTDAARDAMLARMQRHVLRHRRTLPAVPTRTETMRFLRAMGLDREVRHAKWRLLRTRLLRVGKERR